MAHFSLSPKFIKESILLFREKPLREIFLGTKTALSTKEHAFLKKIQTDFSSFKDRGGRTGQFKRADILHTGRGTVFLVPNDLGNPKKESLLICAEDTKIVSGPDLYLYLTTTTSATQPEDAFFSLGKLKGTSGGQAYVIDKPLSTLQRYTYAMVYCKQFAVVFSPAKLT